MCSRSPRACKRGFTRSAVNISWLWTAAPCPAFVNRVANDDLKQHGLTVTAFAQHTPQSLNVFTRTAGSTEYDSDFGLRHIHTFIQDSGSRNRFMHPVLNAFLNMLALSGFGFVCQRRNEVAAGDFINRVVIFGEYQYLLMAVFAQQFFQRQQLLL